MSAHRVEEADPRYADHEAGRSRRTTIIAGDGPRRARPFLAGGSRARAGTARAGGVVSAEIPDAVRENLTLLTVEQVCELFRLKKDFLYDEVKASRIPHVRLGRAIRFRAAELDGWISGKIVPSTVGE